MIPRALIDEARDYHPDFARERTPGRVLLKRLRSSARRIVRKAVEIAQPDVLAVIDSIDNATIVTALNTTDGFVTVPAFITPIAARAIWDPAISSVAQTPVELVYEAERLAGGSFFPSVQVLESQIRFTDLRDLGELVHGWEEVTSVDWVYVPDPELDDPDDLDASMDEDLVGVPDSLQGALVAELALFMARRLGMKDPSYREDLKTEIAEWVYTIQQKGAAIPWRVGPMPHSHGPYPLRGP